MRAMYSSIIELLPIPLSYHNGNRVVNNQSEIILIISLKNERNVIGMQFLY